MAKEAVAVEADRRRAESEERARVAREKAKQRYIYMHTALPIGALHYTFLNICYTYGILPMLTIHDILYVLYVVYRESSARISDRIRAAATSTRSSTTPSCRTTTPTIPTDNNRQPLPLHDTSTNHIHRPLSPFTSTTTHTYTIPPTATMSGSMFSGPSTLTAKILQAQQQGQQPTHMSLEERKRMYQAKIAQINKYRIPRRVS